MELLTPPLIDALNAVVAPKTIVLRNDGAVRRLEQLPESVSVAQGHIDGPVTLEENGARFFADLEGGQKTGRSEEHTSELQSLMRISYAVFCLKKTNKQYKNHQDESTNTRTLKRHKQQNELL